MLCSSGIAVSISLFFIQGVEELPFPKGALMFHLENITKASLLFFVCTVPLIVVRLNQKMGFKELSAKSLAPPKEFSQDDLWEEATLEDVRSGNYEGL